MSEQRRIFSNSISMLVNRVAQAIGSFVLTAAIARTLGAQELGQYILALGYYYIFVEIASQGLKTLFTRELSRDAEQIPVYLTNGSLLQFFLSVIAYIALVIVVWALPYSPNTSLTCYILGLTIIPFSLSNVTEAILQAQERMHVIAICTVPVYVVRLVSMIWAMQLHYGVNYIAGILIFSEILILVIEWLSLTRTVRPRWQIDRGYIIHIIKSARTFFAIDAAGIVANKMDILIISLFGNEAIVGVYGAISQLLVPNTIIIFSLNLAALPRMTKAVHQGLEKQRQIAETLIESLLFMSIPMWIGLYFFGEALLLFVYEDPSFRGTNTALFIFSFALILTPIRAPLSNVLIANGLQRFNLFEVIITLIIGVISGMVLVSQYQLLGSALMRGVVSFSACSLIVWAVYNRLFALRPWKIFSRPILISCSMIPVFMILQRSHLSLLGILAIATSVYLILIGVLSIYFFGGSRNLFKKLSNKA
jgi:O-antigen/teichoic acid export membrane protein